MSVVASFNVLLNWSPYLTLYLRMAALAAHLAYLALAVLTAYLSPYLADPCPHFLLSEVANPAMNVSSNAMTIFPSSLLRSVSPKIQVYFQLWLFKSKWYILEAAVKVSGGAKAVDCDLVISLLWEVVELLKGLLRDLKLIVKAEIILGCTLEVLAEIVGALLIVCLSFFPFLSLFCLILFNFL